MGTDRSSLASRMRSLMDQDIVVSLHSDTPVGIPSPRLEVWIAVNRIGYDSGKVRVPYERVDVGRGMKMVTIDAACTLGEEDKIGSIETGKLADFVVLNDDPQDVDPMKIEDIGVNGASGRHPRKRTRGWAAHSGLVSALSALCRPRPAPHPAVSTTARLLGAAKFGNLYTSFSGV